MSYSTQTGSFNIAALGTDRELFEASGMSNGGTAVLLRTDVTAQNETTNNFYLRMYDNAGTLLGPELDLRSLATNDALYRNDFRILALSNGNVLVAYNKGEAGVTNTGTPDAFFFVVDQTGQKVVQDVQINSFTGSTLTRGLDLVELSNGNIAFSYQRADNYSFGTHVFKPDGTSAGTEALVAGNVNGSLTAIAANTDGSYMVTYSYSLSSSGKVDFKTFSSQGAELTAGTLYTNNANTNTPLWEVIGLSNGSYVFTSAEYGDVNSSAQLLNSAGLATGSFMVGGGGIGSIAPVVGSDGTKGFLTLVTAATTPYGAWATASANERPLEVTLNYYSNVGALVDTTPNFVAGPGYTTSDWASFYPVTFLYAGKTQGSGLLLKQSPNLDTSTGANAEYRLDVRLLDQALPPVVSLSTSNANIVEAAGVATITATLSAAATADTVVTLSFAGTAISGTDYTTSATVITILQGQLTGTATLTAVQDTLDEDNETIVVGIQSVTGGGGATAASGQVTVSITDDDAPPTVSIANASVAEGNSGNAAMVFTVTLGAASGKAISVNYATSDGTATAGSDYTATSGTLNFAAGETSKQITVQVAGDTVLEGNETFTLTLSTPVNSTLGTATATGTIIDDENPAPVVTTPTAITLTDTSAADTFTPVTGTLAATDADGVAGFGITGSSVVSQVIAGVTYDLSRVGTYGTLYVKASTGQYVYVPNATAINALDAGSQSENFTVTATDSNASPATGTAVLAITVNGANDAPTALSLSASSVPQSRGVDATVGNLTTTDAEAAQGHTYTLVAGNGTNDAHNSLFSIAGGTLRAADAGALAAGSYRVLVRTADSAGATFDQAFTVTVVDDVDPTVSFSSIGFSQDTGNTTDFVTRIATQTVTATLSAALGTGERVLGSVDGGASWTDITAGVSNTALTWAGVTLASGLHTLQLKVVDAANNNGPVASQGYVLDTLAPSVPTITSAALTANERPVITGTAEADATITLTVAGATYTTTATGGNWSVNLGSLPSSGTLMQNTNGTNAVSVTATDSAGNQSGAGTQTLTIDAVAPGAPVVTSSALTNDDKPTLSGTAEAGTTVTVTVAGATYITVADGTGWSIDLGNSPINNGALNLNLNGTNAVSVTATDLVGNVSNPGIQSLVIDTTAPATVFSLVGFSADTGSLGTDFITNVPTQTIRATLSVAPAVGDKVFGSLDGGATWTNITASVSSTQLQWVGVGLATGPHTLQLKVTDAAGNNSNIFSQPYTLDTQAPTTRAASNLFSFSGDTGVSASDLITKTAQQTFSGSLNASLAVDEVVEVSVDGGTTWVLATSTVGSTAWSASNLTLLDGSHDLSVRVSDTAGNHGTATSRGYVLDTSAPQFDSARINAASLVLSLADTVALDAVNLPSAAAFTVTIAGNAVVVNDVTVNALAKTVTLTLATAVSAGQVVTVAYADPSIIDDTNAIQDAAGNDFASLAAVPVTNNTPAVPATPTTPTAPPTSVDGVSVQIGTGADGLPQVTIPVVTDGRNEDNSTASNLADIPLVSNGSGVALLTLGVPVGTGVSANGSSTPVSASVAQSQLDSRLPNDAVLKAAGQAFINGLPSTTQVVVQQITLNAQAGNSVPLVINANNTADGHLTALVIDTIALSGQTRLTVNNVDLAFVLGDARVTGGAGANTVFGDDGRQFIVLGEDDDVLHGGGNNDTVGSLRGRDQVFGDDGDDVVYGGTSDDMLTGGGGNDRMNGGFGFDTAAQTGARGDYTVSLDGHAVVLTHKVSGEVDRFLDVEHIVFDSGTSIIVAHESADVAALTAQFSSAELIELNANRAVSGTQANDEVTPDLGMALNVDLGKGIDIVRLAGARSDVHIDVEADERAELTRLEDGAMLAFNQVELLAFANGNVTVLAHNHAEAVVGRAYELLLGRNVDTDGYTFWITGIENGVSLNATLASMMRAPEYTGASTSNSAFVDALYTTGLQRAADADGKTFWLAALDSGVSRAQVLEGFASSLEATKVIGSTIDLAIMT